MPHMCPSRIEGFPYAAPLAGPDDFLRDSSCSFCGSLDPDVFMARLEAGDVELGPTDKNHKVYVANKDGEPFKSTHRTDSKPYQGHHSPEHDWVTTERQETKFYFQHLSEDQQKRFVELLNQKKILIGYPGQFYRLPFFISR